MSKISISRAVVIAGCGPHIIHALIRRGVISCHDKTKIDRGEIDKIKRGADYIRSKYGKVSILHLDELIDFAFGF